MYNPNGIRNMWPSIPPVIPSQINGMAFGLNYNNFNQSLHHSQQLPINTSVLLQNQQNMNQFMPYYNQNQGFGQHLTPFPNSYQNMFQPNLPLNQTNSSLYGFKNQLQTSPQTITQPNVGINSNPLLQTPVLPQIPTNANVLGMDQNLMNCLNPSQKEVLQVLIKEQQEFDLQFKNWEKEFENWKETNRMHPDRNAYQSYVNQWQEWRQKLLSRQQQMKELHTKTMNQLYSQLQLQNPQNIQQNPPPPPPPPPLPEPESAKELPPPPPPEPKPYENNFQPMVSNSLTKNKVNSNENFKLLNDSKDSDVDVLRKDNKTKAFGSDIDDRVVQSNSYSQSQSFESNQVFDSQNRTKSETMTENQQKTDPISVSKAAEDIMFIQQQQEILKALDNFKKLTNEPKPEIEIIDGPKPFNINEIVSQMKAIRPPENQNNLISNQLPSLPGINFNQSAVSRASNPYMTSSNVNNQNTNLISQTFTRPPHENFQRFQAKYNPIQTVDVRNQAIRPYRMPFQRPPFNYSNDNTNRLTPSNTDDPNCSDRYSSNANPDQTNSAKRYSAQTIDYNHRNESMDFDSRQETRFSGANIEPPNQSYHNSSEQNHSDFNYSSNNPSFDSDMYRKPFSQPENTIVEQKLDYRDCRYFTEPNSRVVLIDDLLKPPSRQFRPQYIVIILRGLPGSGKTKTAKMIKELELEFGGTKARILSIDDYFITEIDNEIKDESTGKIVRSIEYVYEYDSEMESSYRTNLLKTFRKTVDDTLYPFIIIDSVNEYIGYIEEFYSYSIKNGFVVYVAEMDCFDPNICHKNNIHHRKLEDIKSLFKKWEPLPDFMLRLDIKSLLQNIAIKEVEMESNTKNETNKRKIQSESESNINKKQTNASLTTEDIPNTQSSVSRWERLDATEAKLDKLDSFKMKNKLTIDEYLQVTEDYEQREGQKRVRWADIEEGKKQVQMRQRGFVVGLDWQQLMDPQHPERALTKTKYF